MSEVSCQCGMQFDSEEALLRHVVKEHGKEVKPVGRCCGVEFYTADGLREHARAAHDR